MAMDQRLDPKTLDLATPDNPARFVYAARALRDFGDGFVAVLLPVYLTAIGLGALEVGIVATFALFGSALMTLGIGLLGALGISQLAALKGMFVAYAMLGLASGLLYARIPAEMPPIEEKPLAALGPSRGIVYKMAALFSIDAFAGGFAVQSLVALWLFSKFGLSISAAGLFFFWSGVFAAFSFPVAAWLSQRIGLVNTMVFTHIPSSLCLILAAVAPNLELALILLLMRAALSQMDVPTRSSYVMAVVTPPERPAAASITSVPRSLAAAASPAMAGALFAAGFEAWPLVICGALKIFYDLTLLWMFRHFARKAFVRNDHHPSRE
jgi:predicted MFS family arabinose efflux permease